MLVVCEEKSMVLMSSGGGRIKDFGGKKVYTPPKKLRPSRTTRVERAPGDSPMQVFLAGCGRSRTPSCGPQGTSSSSAPVPAIRADSRGAARRRAATPGCEGRQHLRAHALDERRRVVGAARDGLADPDAHPHAPRKGEHGVSAEPPGLVDC